MTTYNTRVNVPPVQSLHVFQVDVEAISHAIVAQVGHDIGMLQLFVQIDFNLQGGLDLTWFNRDLKHYLPSGKRLHIYIYMDNHHFEWINQL